MKGEYNSSKQTGRGHVAYISEKTGLMKLREIEYAIINGRAVFEGDIVINTQEGITAAKARGASLLKTGDVSRAMPDVIHAGDVVKGIVVVGVGVRWHDGIILHHRSRPDESGSGNRCYRPLGSEHTHSFPAAHHRGRLCDLLLRSRRLRFECRASGWTTRRMAGERLLHGQCNP
jgi:hypothetical protein